MDTTIKINSDFIKLLSNFEFKIYSHDNTYPKGKIIYNNKNDKWEFDESEEYWDFDIEINGYRLEHLIENRRTNAYEEYLNILFEEYKNDRDISRLKLFLKADCFDLLKSESTILNDSYKGFYDNHEAYEWIDIPEIPCNVPAMPLTANYNSRFIFSEKKKYNDNDSYIQACVSDFLKIQRKIIKKAINYLDQKLEWLKLSNEKSFATSTINEINVLNNHLSWSKSDTDLLELVTALFESKTISNSDNNLSRKEAIEFFSKVFGRDIKDAESKLSRATERKKDISPFLTSLKEAFDNYAIRKEQK